jgi:hypothetical protein
MATFYVTKEQAGKTLRDLFRESEARGEYFPRIDIVAEQAGVSPDTPLTEGQTININDTGSGEGQWVAKNFSSTSTTTPAPVQEPVMTAQPVLGEVAPVQAPLTADQIIQNAIDSTTSLISEPPQPYDEANPFFFDEQLARQAAEAEYSPYYKEKLTDYMSQVEKTKSRSQEDLSKVLEFLSGGKEYFLGKERRLLDQALKQTNEGYAGRNLYFSGARGKDLQEQQTESQATVGEYTRGYGNQVQEAQTGTQRTLEDVSTAASQYQRDIGRQETTAIEGGVLQRKGEAMEEYEAARKKYYSNYPNYYQQYYGQTA